MDSLVLEHHSGNFIKGWQLITILVNTYNWITTWFFLGLAGFPFGAWVVLEVVTEVISMADFFVRHSLRKRMPLIWKQFPQMHRKSHCIACTFDFLASMPFSIIMLISLDEMERAALWVALIRCLKLYHFRENRKLLAGRRTPFQGMKLFVVMYSLFAATHLIGCIWLIVGRIDPDSPHNNWFAMDNFDKNPSMFIKYIEATFFTVATMTGLGYGNVVPTTTLEYVADLFIMVAGASIYASFFADFAVSINLKNAKRTENNKRLEQAKKFARLHSLPQSLFKKMKLYYTSFRVDHGLLAEKYALLEELPLSLRTELSLFINSDLIQKVKFLQLAEPSFILSLARMLQPQLSMAGAFVVEKDGVARDMYFISKGFVEVLATDNKTVLAYMGEGSYFGEIGVLLTGKRTVSVRTKTACIFYTVSGDDLTKILESFPEQLKFLRALARQRLETTHPEDLMASKEDEEEEEDLMIETDGEENADAFSVQSFRRSIRTGDTRLRSQFRRPRIPIHLTYETRLLKKAVIVPFSRLHKIQSFFLILALIYNIFYVPYSIALEVEVAGGLIALDVLAWLIYIFDSFLRARLATDYSPDNELITDPHKVFKSYLDKYALLDFMAIMPVDYICKPFGVSITIRSFTRLLRLLKVARLIEKQNRKRSKVNVPIFTIFLLAIMFVLCSHLMACTYIFIGRREDILGSRYDGQSMFENLLARDFVNL